MCTEANSRPLRSLDPEQSFINGIVQAVAGILSICFGPAASHFSWSDGGLSYNSFSYIITISGVNSAKSGFWMLFARYRQQHAGGINGFVSLVFSLVMAVISVIFSCVSWWFCYIFILTVQVRMSPISHWWATGIHRL